MPSSDVVHSVGRPRWNLPTPEPSADNALLDAKVHDARHLLRLKGDYVLSFVISCHNQEAEVLVLVQDHAGRIS